MICDYGCSQEAKFKLKNNKLCCNESYKSCPGVGKKISESKKGSSSWNKGLTKEIDERVKLGSEKAHTKERRELQKELMLGGNF